MNILPEQENTDNTQGKVRPYDLIKPLVRLFKTPDEIGLYQFLSQADATLDRIDSSALRRKIRGIFRGKFGTIPADGAVESTIQALEHDALEGDHTVTPFRRYGHHDGRIYVDTGRGYYVEIDAEGFRVVARSPVFFTRPRGFLPLPDPGEGVGTVNALWEVLGVEDDRARILLTAAILGFMNPCIHAAAICLDGPQGTGKTSISTAIKAIVDPEQHGQRAFPKGEHDLAILCRNRWLLAFDNLSGLKDWAQDALCRAITGGSYSARQLYTSEEEINLELHNPILMNGIDDIATRPDLADRSIVVPLPPIPPEKRRQARDIWTEFQDRLPEILRGFYSAVSCGLKNLPEIRLDELPRMADFAAFVTAAEPALGLAPRTFLWHYEEAMEATNAANLEAFPAMDLLVSFVEEAVAGRIIASPTELLNRLNHQVEKLAEWDLKKHPTWPKTAQSLTNQIKRALPLLKTRGVAAALGRTRETRQWTLWKSGMMSSLASPPSSGHRDERDGGDETWN